ncbi:MAG: DUF1937 family protein [Candidatus Izemoplasmatales bacterium]
MTLLYLASPYSGTRELEDERWKAIAEITDRFRRIGVAAYSPVALWHPIARQLDLPQNFFTYSAVDLEMLRRCDAFVIVPLPGWLSSRGMEEEWRAAREENLPCMILDILTLVSTTIDWYSWPTKQESLWIGK